MRKSIYFVTILSAFIFICSNALAGKGNGLPPGPRFMLNVIAFDNCPSGDFTDSNRHMIAVKANYTLDQNGQLAANLTKTNTIQLTAGPQNLFEVMDGNACDKGGAKFMLPPNPFDCGTGTPNDPNCTGENLTFQSYQVYVRLVGKPGTAIDVTTCAIDDMGTPDDLSDDTTICSTENVVKVRMTGKGKMMFDDVTRQLTTLCVDTSYPADGVCDQRIPLFSGEYYDYFWQWDTTGKAHAQLVFIPIPD